MRSILSPKILGEFLGTCFLVMVVIGSGIMASKLSDDELTVLLANTIATGAGLTALIWVFISISGAHFNPAVTLVMFMKNEIQVLLMLLFIGAQISGGLLGVLLAHGMFGLDVFQISENYRGDIHKYLAEFIATFGLLMVILGVRQFSIFAVAPAVGLYISAGYWFTSSTSFANPAVTIARAFTDTFTGIDPEFVGPFLVAQFSGAVVASLIMGKIQSETSQ